MSSSPVPGSPTGLSEGDRTDLETAQQQLEAIESELMQLSLNSIEPEMHDSLMNKLREVRTNIHGRLQQLSPVGQRPTAKRVQSARPTRGLTSEYSQASGSARKQRPATAGAARSKQSSRRAFPPPSAGRSRRPPTSRSAIELDMMKLVDGHRPTSGTLQHDAGADLSTMSFTAMVASRPGPGPSQYYPEYTNASVRPKACISSFGREDRFKHLAGESKPGNGRIGPGPKYKPSVRQRKQRMPVATMGRENRLGSSVAP